MRRPGWVRLILIFVGGVTATAVLVLYGGSEYMLRQRHPVMGKALTPAADSTSLAEGRHLVALRGCLGCHGKQGEGKVFFDEPQVGTVVAPIAP